MIGAKATRANSRMLWPLSANFQRPAFRRDRFPDPAAYYAGAGVKLRGVGGWCNALCPSHKDTRPSMRVVVETGAFRDRASGAHGGDVLAVHMRRHGVPSVKTGKLLGVCGVGQ